MFPVNHLPCDNHIGTCPSCKSREALCKNNATCKMLMDDAKKNCKDIFEWDESARESEPTCTDECKDSIMKFHDFGGGRHHCCSCGNISDDNNLDTISYAIKCNQKRRNAMRWCANDTMLQQHMMCEECRPGNHILM